MHPHKPENYSRNFFSTFLFQSGLFQCSAEAQFTSGPTHCLPRTGMSVLEDVWPS